MSADGPAGGQGRSGDRSAAGRRGREGEAEAARFLRAQGLTILHSNWRCRLGELDIVAADGPCLVFVEVKTRSGSEFGTAAEAVDVRKQRRLQRLAAAYLNQSGEWERPCRFDVVAVTPAGSGWQSEWIRDAFRP